MSRAQNLNAIGVDSFEKLDDFKWLNAGTDWQDFFGRRKSIAVTLQSLNLIYIYV